MHLSKGGKPNELDGKVGKLRNERVNVAIDNDFFLYLQLTIRFKAHISTSISNAE